MLKKTITYTDFNDVVRAEDFYFNLTKAEIMELELTTPGGFAETLERIVKTQDAPALMRIFKDVILRAYGEKSADGKRFVKSEELSNAFAQTEAYSVLFMELVTDADAASKFMNGLIPADLAQQGSRQTVAPAN